LATDESLSDAYDPSLVKTLLGEAAWLLRNLGFTAQHTILIGGLVPSLLVLDPPGAPHLGTGDLDLCLSMAIVTGDTAEYERLETALTLAGYEPTEFSFRWRQRDGLHLAVEFFCAASDDRPAGKMFRPKATINPTAKLNFGPKLTAIALDAGGVIEADMHDIEIDVDLPQAAGRTRFTFRVTGLLGFLAAKTAAWCTHSMYVLDVVDALGHVDAGAAGMLLDESHESLRRDFEVSTTTLDSLVEHLRGLPGVLGARMTGAGFGGMVVVLMEAGAALPSSVDATR